MRNGIDLDHDAWGAVYRSHYTDNPNIGARDRLVIHHTASSYPASADAFPATLRQLENYGHGRDGADIEYHALVAHGMVAEGFLPRIRGCHAVAKDPSGRSYNDTALGLCLLGYYYPPYSQVPARADGEAMARWVAGRIVDGDLSPAVLTHASAEGQPGWYGHIDVDATACPGSTYEYIDAVMAHAAELAGAAPPPANPGPMPPDNPPIPGYPPFPLAPGDAYTTSVHNGYHGGPDHQNVAVLQDQLAERGWTITTDGFYGAKTAEVVTKFQREKHLDDDGMVGAQTWPALWTAPVT